MPSVTGRKVRLGLDLGPDLEERPVRTVTTAALAALTLGLGIAPAGQILIRGAQHLENRALAILRQRGSVRQIARILFRCLPELLQPLLDTALLDQRSSFSGETLRSTACEAREQDRQ